MERRAFAAINVTIPYKQFVIPYCDVVDPKAQAIGAVNTIVNRDGKLYGYNTDYAALPICRGPRRRFCGQDRADPGHGRYALDGHGGLPRRRG